MGATVLNDFGADLNLIQRAARGEDEAVSELFAKHEARLKRMVRLRLNRRLQGRIDSSDVLQEAYLEIVNKLDEYLRNPEAPFFLWLGQITGYKLADIHRRHLGTQMRNAERDFPSSVARFPRPIRCRLAAQLLRDNSPAPHTRLSRPRCGNGSRECLTPWSRSIAKSSR